jgi:hypothetical protein
MSQGPEDRELGEKTIQWVAAAFRVLSFKELQCALAVLPDDREYDPDGETSEEKVLSVCAGLITVDHESRAVRLIRERLLIYFNNNSITH